MSDPNSSPVSLPAGSHDYDDLKKGLEHSAKGAVSSYDANVTKALAGASTSAHEEVDVRAIPDNHFVDVKNDELGVTERVQVFVPEGTAKPRAPRHAPPAKPGARSGRKPRAARKAEAPSPATLQNTQAETRADAQAAAATPKE